MSLSKTTRLIITTAVASFCMTGMLSAEGSLDKIFSNVKAHFNCEVECSSETLESRKGGSYQYNQSFGSEKVNLEFPKKPSTKKKDGILMATVKANNMEYGLVAPKPPMGVSADYIFSFLLDELNTKPYSVIDHYTYGDNFGDVMEVTSTDKKRKKIQKSKLIVTSENFYLISVEFPENKEDPSVDHFLDSFDITN